MMTDPAHTPEKTRRTPDDASDFEREQLTFFLSQSDLGTTLVTLNPSLAWLPFLSEMKLVQNDVQLAPWIEQNFADLEAVREVVANLRFFGAGTANFLDHRLNARAEQLPPLLVKCWRLIIRHMRTTKHAGLQNDWFEIKPRIERGEASADLIERLAESLRPRLRIGKRLSFRDDTDDVPESPSQIMSIDYEVEDWLTADEVLSTWPEDSAADRDFRLLSALTDALGAALEDATDAGVEGGKGYSTSDSDVPSVAKHAQNEHHSGFSAIVSVMAALWERLASKSPSLALPFVQDWRDRPYRLMRRLSLFACASPIVPAEFAANVLIALPQGELFLTGSTVEVFRLIRARWNEFHKSKQDNILRRFCEGPPRGWYRSSSDVDTHIDRDRFNILGDMERMGFTLGAEADAMLNDIRVRWPQWQLRPPEQAGFHIWHGVGGWLKGDAKKLESLPHGELVPEAKRLAATAEFLSGDDWQALCLSNPDRALRGLDAAAQAGDWAPELWQQLLWSRKEYTDSNSEQRIAELLMLWPTESFGEIVTPASSWLNEHAQTLSDHVLWPLWDRIAETVLEIEDAPDA